MEIRRPFRCLCEEKSFFQCSGEGNYTFVVMPSVTYLTNPEFLAVDNLITLINVDWLAHALLLLMIISV